MSGDAERTPNVNVRRTITTPAAGSSVEVYADLMKTEWQGRISQAAAKYGENAPMAATCCNACRTCVQTNAIAAVLAVGIGVGVGIARVARRVVHRDAATT